MTDHKVVSRAEWQAACDELLQREKEHTRMADELARQRHCSERRRDPIVVLSELSWPASRQRMPRPPEVMRLGRATSAGRNV